MPTIVSSPAQAQYPGVYALLTSPPRIIRGISLGYIGCLGQFDAGPVQTGYLPSSGDDLIQTFEPRGTVRAKSGYYGLMRCLSAPWFIVGIKGGSAGLSPPTGGSAAVTGTPGAATVTWKITALNAAGETIGSTLITATTCNATLSLSPVNLAWLAVLNATTYSVYRIAGGPSQGRVATAQAGLTFTDNGGAAGAAIPVVNSTGYTPASVELLGTGGTIIATALWAGVWGNSLTWQRVVNPNDATKQDWTFTLTNAITGTTQEIYRGVALNQSMATLLAASRLIGSITYTGTLTVFPTVGTSTLSNGSDGAAPVASDYQTGLTQLGLSGNVRVVVADDCGDTVRAAVNGNIVTHCTNLYNRVCFIAGNSGNTWAQTKTDKASYTSELATYCGAWVSVFDDSGTTLVNVPLTTFCATARAMIPVHWSIANHDSQVVKFFQNVRQLAVVNGAVPYNTADDTIRGEAWTNQIVLPIQFVGPQPGTIGPWGILHGRTCNLTSGYQYEVTIWYRIYLVTALAPQLDPYVNGPNDLATGLEIQLIVNAWLDGEVSLKHLTPSLSTDGQNTILPPYSTDIQGVNSGTTMANGDFYVAIDGHTPGVRERLFLALNIGETVSVRRAA